MRTSIIAFLTLISFSVLNAQDILLDKTVRAGDLTLFQSVSKPNEYYYLSDKPKLAVNATTGKPEFSFLRYVENQKGSGDQATKDEGEGGGIVHCVIELGISPQQISAAKQDLQRVNPNGVITGPAIYSGGTIALISSVNDPATGFSKKVLGLGKAPILDGQKAAISINLTKLGAKILWESFKTPTPDMSFSFEMDLKGYKSPKRAIVEANFDQIYQHQNFSAAAITRQGSTILAGEINNTFEDLTKTGAIKVTTFNPDESMEKAVEDAYGKLTRLMFESSGFTPPGGSATPGLPGAAPASLLDRAQTLLNEGRRDALEDFMLFEGQERQVLSRARERENNAGSGGGTGATGGSGGSGGGAEHGGLHDGVERPPSVDGYDAPPERFPVTRQRPTMPTTAAVFSYTMKTVRQRGIFRIDLNKYTVDNLSLRFDQNVGAIKCDDCFRQINLDDPLYKQREVFAIVDGYNADDFQKYINYVAVAFRKKHENGEYTNYDLNIDRAKFNQQGNSFSFLYGWKGDNNRLKWRDFEYKTVWNFFGGATIESTWLKSDVASVPLSPPYQRRLIDIEMDPTVVEKEGIRSAEVKISYKVEDKEMVKQIRLNPKTGLLTTQVEVLLPAPYINPDPKFEYEVIWNLTNGSTKKSLKKSTNGLVIYADQL